MKPISFLQQIAKRLLELGFEVDALDEWGITPLSVASIRGATLSLCLSKKVTEWSWSRRGNRRRSRKKAEKKQKKKTEKEKEEEGRREEEDEKRRKAER